MLSAAYADGGAAGAARGAAAAADGGAAGAAWEAAAAAGGGAVGAVDSSIRRQLVGAAPLLASPREPYGAPALQGGEMKLLIDCELELSSHLARSLPWVP